MKVFYDAEFNDNGKTIDLISLGMVRDDGKEYYAVNAGVNWIPVWNKPWLQENVVPHLPLMPGTLLGKPYMTLDRTHPEVKPHAQIAEEVANFLEDAAVASGEKGKLELWSWYGAYDHVVLCQLWGPMVGKPSFIPHYTNDVRQEFERLGNPKFAEPSGNHNALVDAHYHKRLYDFIKKYEQNKKTIDLLHNGLFA